MKPIHALCSTAIAATVFLPNFAFAQAETALKPDTQWRLVPLKNIPPALMAWLVDSQHNPVPDKPIVPLSQAPTTTTPEKTKRATIGLFELPEGVLAVLPAPTQNGLLIQSTEQGARQLQNIVNLLDRPLREVEITAQVFAITDEDTKTLGLDLTRANTPFAVTPQNGEATASYQLGFARGDYQARLDRLVDQNKAEIVANFGVTTLNNMAASMGMTTSLPAIVGIKGAAGAFESVFDATQNTPAPRLFVTRETGFIVTPTINNDGTITIVLKPMQTLQLTLGEKKSGQILPFGSQSVLPMALPQTTKDGITLSTAETKAQPSVQTVANFKDGATIALIGLPRSLFDIALPKQSTDAPTMPAQVIVFITAHVLKPLN